MTSRPARAKREDLAQLPGQELQRERRKRARVDRCHREGGLPPKASVLGLIEQAPEEIIGLCVSFVNIFAEDEELEWRDWSHPLPELKRIEMSKRRKTKIAEPEQISQIPALFDKDVELKA